MRKRRPGHQRPLREASGCVGSHPHLSGMLVGFFPIAPSSAAFRLRLRRHRPTTSPDRARPAHDAIAARRLSLGVRGLRSSDPCRRGSAGSPPPFSLPELGSRLAGLRGIAALSAAADATLPRSRARKASCGHMCNDGAKRAAQLPGDRCAKLCLRDASSLWQAR